MGEKKGVMNDELAAQEFDRWADGMDLDFDVNENDENNKALLETGRRAVVRGLKRGSLIINDDGNLVLTVSKHSPQKYAGEEIVLQMPGAHAFSTSGKSQNNMDIVVGVITAMTGKDRAYLMSLSLLDYKVLQAVAGLFLLG